MEQRDRLIELIDDFIDTVDVKRWYSEKLDEHLADYLLANGIIHIPCKVGDMVYQTDGVRIYELTILDISLHKNMPYYETDAIDFDDTVISKTVFLTKEEAERELERRKQ